MMLLKRSFFSRFICATQSLALVVPLLCGTAACASKSAPARDANSYANDARNAYQKALESFLDRDWEDARLRLQDVKRTYAYSQYARLAELRLADIDFEEEKFPTAITAYRAFAHDHRMDDSVPYARFRICRALYNQISDTLFLPPQEERDQAATVDAYRELSSFLQDYPDTKWTQDATFMLVMATGRLVRHELYVARYNLAHDNFDAAIGRIHYALQHYEGSGLEPEAMVLLAETHLKKKQKKEAREVLHQLLSEFPSSPFSTPARKLLARLDTQSGLLVL